MKWRWNPAFLLIFCASWLTRKKENSAPRGDRRATIALFTVNATGGGVERASRYPLASRYTNTRMYTCAQTRGRRRRRNSCTHTHAHSTARVLARGMSGTRTHVHMCSVTPALASGLFLVCEWVRRQCVGVWRGFMDDDHSRRQADDAILGMEYHHWSSSTRRDVDACRCCWHTPKVSETPDDRQTMTRVWRRWLLGHPHRGKCVCDEKNMAVRALLRCMPGGSGFSLVSHSDITAWSLLQPNRFHSLFTLFSSCESQGMWLASLQLNGCLDGV